MLQNTANTNANSLYAKNYMNFSEYASFLCGKFGQTSLWSFVNGWILFYYTDVVGLPALSVGTLMLVARIWDGINDPMMGVLVDRTRSRWGKLRPYFLFTSVPTMIITSLTFLNPNFSPSGKLIYAYITYIAWGMIYTVSDMPFWSLPSVMSPNPKEREKYISFGNVSGALAGGLVGLIPIIIGLAGKDQQVPLFRMFGLIVGLLGMTGQFITFKGTRERIRPPKEKVSLFTQIKLILKNKLMLIYWLSSMSGWIRGIEGGLNFYFTWYVVRTTVTANASDPGTAATAIFTVLGLLYGIPQILGNLLFPVIVSRFKLSYRNIIIANNLASAGALFIIYFACKPFVFENPSTLWFVAIYGAVKLIQGAFGGLSGNADAMVCTEAMDYLEWKTGQRGEGTSFSFVTLFGKAGGGITGFLVTLILRLLNYVPNVDQTMSTVKGLYGAYFLIPALGFLLAAIPYFFYDFVGEKRERILGELQQKRGEQRAQEALE